MTPRIALFLAAAAPAAVSTACPPSKPAKPAEEFITATVVAEHVKVLADDAMEGRGIGTKGLDLSADYIAAEMKKAGLAPGGPDGSWFQPFDMTVGVALGDGNALAMNGKAAKLGEDWTPFAFSESASAEAELLFAGYGITAPELGWDDYDGIDAKGKIVVVLRHEPGEKDPKSPFNGDQLTRYSELRMKAINARVHGAAGLIVVQDRLAHPYVEEQLIKLASDDGASFAGVPAVHVRRDRVAFAGLDAAEKRIADSGKPSSGPLEGKATITVAVTKQKKPVKNVIGVLRGSSEKLGGEAVVVGAHYDHLGMGGSDSLDPNKVGQPHNGADDNASGTSAMLAIARAISHSRMRPARTLLFMAFTAEEAGLGGSSWYVNHPTWPLGKTVAMLNMDMVGRMKDRKVVAFGAATGKEFGGILEKANAEGLALTAKGDGYGPSDQTVFYGKDIPVLHFFTGAHADYHRTTDDTEKIESEGLAQVARLVTRVTLAIANADAKPTFVASKAVAHAQGQVGGTGGYGAWLGSVPDFTEGEEPGVPITGTSAGSPAEKAGLLGGDRITKLGEVTVNNLHDLTFALQKYKPGDEVELVFVRGAETKTIKIVLGKRK